MPAVKSVPVEAGVKPSSIWSGRGQPSAREAVMAAAYQLGGVDGLVAWARKDPKNEYMFWTRIYPRLIPLDVNVQSDVRLAQVLTWLPPK